MEKSRKMMVSLALIAIIAVAAIGIGYAYTASTSNSGNDANTKYLVVTPMSDASTQSYSDDFDATIAFDTDKTSGHITYSLADDLLAPVLLPYGEATDREVIQIGQLYLVIDQQETTAAKYDFNLIASSGTMNNADLGYVFKLQTTTCDEVNAAAMTAADSASTLDTDLIYVDYNATTGVSWSNLTKTADNYRIVKVTMYVCIKDGDTKELTDPALPPVAVLTNVTFAFRVVAEPASPVVSYGVYVTTGDNMSMDAGSGALKQRVAPTNSIVSIKINATGDKTFTSTYMGATGGSLDLGNGLTLTVNSPGTAGNYITISGTPTASSEVTLASLT